MDRRRAVRVYAMWLVGASVIGGAALAAQTIYALRAFDAQQRALGIVAVAAVRSSGPSVAATAALFGAIAGIHGRDARERPRAAALAVLAGAILFGSVVAISIEVAVGMLVSSLAGVGPGVAWRMMLETLAPEDALFALAVDVASIVFWAALASTRLRVLAADGRRSVVFKCVVALLALKCAAIAVGFVIG